MYVGMYACMHAGLYVCVYMHRCPSACADDEKVHLPGDNTVEVGGDTVRGGWVCVPVGYNSILRSWCQVCSYLSIYLSIHLFVCLSIYICVCMYLCMCACIYISIYICMYVCVYAGIHVCMHVGR